MDNAQADVDKQIETDNDFAQHHSNLRSDRAQGGNEYADLEKSTVAEYVEEKKEQFKKTFAPKFFYDLETFADQRSIEYESGDELIKYIEDTLHLEVVVGKNGELGVQVEDLPKGAKYKVEEGIQEGTSLTTKHKYAYDQAAKDKFSALMKKKQGAGTSVLDSSRAGSSHDRVSGLGSRISSAASMAGSRCVLFVEVAVEGEHYFCLGGAGIIKIRTQLRFIMKLRKW